jgi:protein gp37
VKNSSIQWTDHTFNAWEGCTKVAPECKNCYAEVLVDKRFGRAKWGKGQPRRRTSENLWKQPLAWNRQVFGECPGCGQRAAFDADGMPCGQPDSMCCTDTPRIVRPRVFCLSLGDWLDEEVPIEWLSDLLFLIWKCGNLDWQLLTKRPQNWRERIAAALMFASNHDRFEISFIRWLQNWTQAHLMGLDELAPDNIWIGVSAGADQKAALEIPAKIHFLSCEPMLHALDTTHAAEFDQIIFGGESGKNARRSDVDWIEKGIEFCGIHGISAFVKQLGAKPHIADVSHPHGWEGNNVDWESTGRIYLKDSHGGDMSEWPEDLRVREFPKQDKLSSVVNGNEEQPVAPVNKNEIFG